VIRLAVRVERSHAEEALVELLAFSPAGVEEVEVDAGTVEYVIYGAAGELPSMPALEASVGDCLVTVRTSEIGDDWSERWREFHRPIDVAQRLHVRPPWHPPPPTTELLDIVIEPGQAFGTGAHATSRLCLELLVELERDGAACGALLDVGCGSGILAITAAKLGFAPVIALDNDRACVEASNANAAANLLLAPLLLLSERLEHRPAHLIVSGLLGGQGEELEHELEARHLLRRAASRRDGDWLAMLFVGAAPRVSS
jgi:ribosomal protein L11 methyltransferase